MAKNHGRNPAKTLGKRTRSRRLDLFSYSNKQILHRTGNRCFRRRTKLRGLICLVNLSHKQKKSRRTMFCTPGFFISRLYKQRSDYHFFSISGSQIFTSVSKSKNLHLSIFGVKFTVSPSCGFTTGSLLATMFTF